MPPFGFESVPGYLDELYDRIVASGADLVYVGLGFPKQERFAAPWCRGCRRRGSSAAAAGIGMAAGWRQARPAGSSSSVGWTHRLAQEPRRLAKRYLVDDIPAAVRLLGMSARTR